MDVSWITKATKPLDLPPEVALGFVRAVRHLTNLIKANRRLSLLAKIRVFTVR